MEQQNKVGGALEGSGFRSNTELHRYHWTAQLAQRSAMEHKYVLRCIRGTLKCKENSQLFMAVKKIYILTAN